MRGVPPPKKQAFNKLQQERHEMQEDLLKAQKVSQQLAEDDNRISLCSWEHWRKIHAIFEIRVAHVLLIGSLIDLQKQS